MTISQGHKAGDILIQNTMKYINMVFPNLIYRISGDEFVVLVPEISEQKFIQKVQEAQTALEENGISVSEQCDDLNEQIKEETTRCMTRRNCFTRIFQDGVQVYNKI